MPLDAVALGLVAQELNTYLTGARVDKIYQPERDEIVLVLAAQSGQKKLVISANSANARIHLTDRMKENPASPPMFCMLLRKHLTNARIQGIVRKDCDRVMDIEFICRSEMGDSVSKKLICEIMGRNSNIILTDADNKITDSIKHIDLTLSTLRNVLPGLTYFPPPSGDRLNPESASEEDFYNVLKNAPEGRASDRAVTDAVSGISPLLARECVFRACGDGAAMVGQLSEDEKRRAAKELYMLFERARSGDFSPCILFQGEKCIDISPFEILQYGDNIECRKTESMNTALQQYFYMRDLYARMKERGSAVTKVITNNLSRAEKKLDILQTELKEAQKREYYKICGDIIAANIYRIKKGDTVLIAPNYYENGAPETEITLDKRKSPSQNAEKYYLKYKKAKNTEKYAAQQIIITKNEIDYLNSVYYSVSNAKTPSDLASIKSELEDSGYIKKSTAPKKKANQAMLLPREFECDGYTILVGRNNVQNDYLTMKLSRKGDMWLHAKNIAGSHTIIKYKGEEFPNNVIETAARLAAYFSSGRNSKYVEVDYCPVSHVKKPSGAKAGMVIYDVYNTALVTPGEDIVKESESSLK